MCSDRQVVSLEEYVSRSDTDVSTVRVVVNGLSVDIDGQTGSLGYLTEDVSRISLGINSVIFSNVMGIISFLMA